MSTSLPDGLTLRCKTISVPFGCSRAESALLTLTCAPNARTPTCGRVLGVKLLCAFVLFRAQMLSAQFAATGEQAVALLGSGGLSRPPPPLLPPLPQTISSRCMYIAALVRSYAFWAVAVAMAVLCVASAVLLMVASAAVAFYMLLQLAALLFSVILVVNIAAAIMVDFLTDFRNSRKVRYEVIQNGCNSHKVQALSSEDTKGQVP